jgi:hypothetical protein
MSDKLTQAAELLSQALREITQDNTTSQDDRVVVFKADKDGNNYGKGLMWQGQGHTRQFIFTKGDKFVSSESIELLKDQTFNINNNTVLSETQLGSGVVKSNLREVGRLRGLVVDGSVNIGQYIVYNNNNNRLGLGTENPNAALSIAEDGIELMLGSSIGGRAIVGTFGSNDLDILTDSTPRITIEGGGNIKLGNKAFGPIQVHVHGKLAVGVKTIDTRADVHVAGAIKFNERLHQYLSAPPDNGTYERGSIVWNTDPEVGRCVGWVCTRSGSPGSWMPFGEIKQSG